MEFKLGEKYFFDLNGDTPITYTVVDSSIFGITFMARSALNGKTWKVGPWDGYALLSHFHKIKKNNAKVV